MRRYRTFAVAILAGVLISALAVPAGATPRFRFYRGATSQENRIVFVVGRTDAGRFLEEVTVHLSITCDDSTTQDFGWGYGFGRGDVPIASDGTFAYDDEGTSAKFHIEGRIGFRSSEGTVSLLIPTLTADHQAQLCTSGDLTWSAHHVRRVSF